MMDKPFVSFKEFLNLFWLNLKVKKRNFIEFIKVAGKYYWNASFRKVDLALLWAYVYENPFRMSKKFLKERGQKNVYAYGETPLTTLELIAKECQLTPQDLVFELGSGRGRNCFWLNAFIGCKVVGIEHLPRFVEIANKVAHKCGVKGVEFRQQDLFKTNYSEATVLYLYGTCLADEEIKALVKTLSQLPSGIKIITVSYELNDFSEKKLFETMNCFTAPYTWGSTEVYLQIKK